MMRSATDFLPRVISTFTNLATSTLLNFGSGRISRFGTSLRRGMASVPFGFMLWRAYAAFGRLAPYFERPCLRSFTPCVSRLPRTM